MEGKFGCSKWKVPLLDYAQQSHPWPIFVSEDKVCILFIIMICFKKAALQFINCFNRFSLHISNPAWQYQQVTLFRARYFQLISTFDKNINTFAISGNLSQTSLKILVAIKYIFIFYLLSASLLDTPFLILAFHNFFVMHLLHLSNVLKVISISVFSSKRNVFLFYFSTKVFE